jgi:hypothetical protein
MIVEQDMTDTKTTSNHARRDARGLRFHGRVGLPTDRQVEKWTV